MEPAEKFSRKNFVTLDTFIANRILERLSTNQSNPPPPVFQLKQENVNGQPHAAKENGESKDVLLKEKEEGEIQEDVLLLEDQEDGEILEDVLLLEDGEDGEILDMEVEEHDGETFCKSTSSAGSTAGDSDHLVIDETRRATVNLKTTTTSKDPNVYKSLAEIIAQRNIKRPREQKSRNIDTKFTATTGGDKRDQKNGASRTVALRKDVDPYNCSLDDLVERPRSTLDKKITYSTRVPGGKRKYQNLVSREDNDLSFSHILNQPDTLARMAEFPKGLTPYRALGQFSEYGMLIEFRIGTLIDNCGNNHDHFWRCEVSCGSISARADSSRKVVAREVASNEFLVLLARSCPHIEIPRLRIPDGVFINPKVCKWVLDLAQRQGKELKIETCIKKVDSRKRRPGAPEYLHVCTYFIGDEVFEGIDPNVEYATLEAAGAAFEKLSKRLMPLSKYLVGNACDLELNYNFVESETYNVLALDHGLRDDTDDEGQLHAKSSLGTVKSEDTIQGSQKRRKYAEERRHEKDEYHERRRNLAVDLNSRSNDFTGRPSFPSRDQERAQYSNGSGNKGGFKVEEEPPAFGAFKVGRGRSRSKREADEKKILNV